MSEEDDYKLARLIDNSKFKAANVGRVNPVPTILIRRNNNKEAHELRERLGFGKIKRRGSSSILTLGPEPLRNIIPRVLPYLVKQKDKAIIFEEWLKLLDDNEFNQSNAEINNRRIQELKKRLIDRNTNIEDINDIVVNGEGSVEVKILMLHNYKKTPQNLRTPYIQNKIDTLIAEIRELEPNLNLEQI